jgi:3-hydroxy acid dehydrogenase/malonic semialdehyde reductase
MISLKNKIVFITGASSGFGKSCAEQFASFGARLILAARRIDRLDSLAHELKTKFGVEILTLKLDVQDKIQVKKSIENLDKSWQEIDILVNNAGLARGTDRMQDAKIENWETMIQTNVVGLLYVTHAILPGMFERNRGHIVNIGSVAGHECYPAGNIYSATKHAVRAISKSLRLDLLGKAIRVSEVDPGAAHTEFSAVRWNSAEMGDKLYEGFKPLVADDIADAVLYCVTRPAHINISELVIYPVAQASVNHLHKDGQIPKGIIEK